jgi:hypothetical protein
MKHATSKDKPKTELCNLFYKYGADKCPQIYHSYSLKYYELLKKYKEKFDNVLEIGIGTNELMKPIVGDKYQVGASLKAWKDFFINATIFGLDIDNDVLFEEDRIKCFYTDQSDKNELINSINKIRNYKNNNNLLFDLILDDGSHILKHQLLTFNTIFKYLKNGGIYIIEDIQRNNINNLKFNLDNISNAKIIEIHNGVSKLSGDVFIAIKKNI